MDVSNRNRSGSSPTLVWIIIAGVGIVVGGFLIGMLQPRLVPVAGSTQAQQVDNLFRFMLVIAGAVFLLVQGALAFSVIRFRAAPGDLSDGPAIHGNTTLEFIWTAIPAVVVLAITIYAYSVWQNTRAAQPGEAIVGSVGQRFAWTFTYDVPVEDFPAGINLSELEPAIQEDINEDGSVRIVSDQLYTYVNQPVKMEMRTEDVIHSFWIPAMRIKQDLLPGRTTEVRFTPIEPGPYRIVCAELCGSGHGNMAGQVVTNLETGEPYFAGAWLIVYPDEETYRREFLEPELREILFPPEDPAERGRQLLASGQYPCATCHTLSDLNWSGAIGPSLNGIGGRTQRLSGSGQPTIEDYIHQSIRNPSAYLVPGFGNLMPQFNPEPDQPNYMPEADLEAIVAYLLTQTGP